MTDALSKSQRSPETCPMRTLRRLQADRYARLAAIGTGAVTVLSLLLFHLFANSRDWTGGSPTVAIIIVLGAVATGVLGVALMSLAFFSSRHGFDGPGPPPPGASDAQPPQQIGDLTC